MVFETCVSCIFKYLRWFVCESARVIVSVYKTKKLGNILIYFSTLAATNYKNNYLCSQYTRELKTKPKKEQLQRII